MLDACLPISIPDSSGPLTLGPPGRRAHSVITRRAEHAGPGVRHRTRSREHGSPLAIPSVRESHPTIRFSRAADAADGGVGCNRMFGA
jgi:hypothetical protein